MYRCVSNITIIQQPNAKLTQYPQRNKTLNFDFVHEYECTDSWRTLTNNGKIIVPKNLYVRDANNKLVPLFGTNVNIGGFSTNAPLIMRGDKVIIDWGYRYFKNGIDVFEGTFNTKDNTHLFVGYVSEVTSKKPIEFLIEDNMWILKQIPAPIKTFAPTDTLENILTTLLKGTNFTVNALTQTTFGAFRMGNETVCEVLARLRKEFHFESYFRGNELRCGAIVYIPSEANERTFIFQSKADYGAIISDDLEYKRKDDIVLSATCQNTIEEETGKQTKDGQNKTKKVRLEVLITLRYGSDTPDVFIKKKGEDYPPNTGGERKQLFFPGAKSINELVALGTPVLARYYYTGFKGKFTTFGIPYVKMGDNVSLVDPILPERNGKYKVRSVEYSGGVNGLRQVIELDFKIN